MKRGELTLNRDYEEVGRFFRNAWITGVHQYFPGTPKPGYISLWEEMEQWERDSAIAAYKHTEAFILAGVQQGRYVSRLTEEQGGRLVCMIWVDQMRIHFGDSKPSYLSPWEDLPAWQQKVDVSIFGAIQSKVLQEVGTGGTLST